MYSILSDPKKSEDFQTSVYEFIAAVLETQVPLSLPSFSSPIALHPSFLISLISLPPACPFEHHFDRRERIGKGIQRDPKVRLPLAHP